MQGHRTFSSASTLFALALAFLASPVNSLAGAPPPARIGSPATIEGFESPTILFDDLDDVDFNWEWAIVADAGEGIDETAPVSVEDVTPGNNRFTIYTNLEVPPMVLNDEPKAITPPSMNAIPVVTINSPGDGTVADSLVVQLDGDIELKQGLFEFSEGDGFTAQTINSTNASFIGLRSIDEETSENSVEAVLYSSLAEGARELAGYGFYDAGSSSFPLFIQPGVPDDTLVMTPGGVVATAGKIHVGSPETPVGQFTITSTEQPRFELNDITNNRRWRFSVTNTAFAINNLDETGTEFKSFNNGDLEIGGALFENSDRNSKQDIVAVDHLSVLDRIVALPISEWSYKDAPNQRHLGPMAQDFHAAFGLGRNNTGISTLDTAGVALAGIKALKWQNDRLAAENASLKDRVEAMESRQVEIMAMLATLRAQQDQPAPVVASLRD